MLPAAGGPPVVVVGTGPVGGRRRAARRGRRLRPRRRAAGPPGGRACPSIDGIAADRAGQVVTEGVLLARYRYDVLQTKTNGVGRSRPSR